MRSHEVEARVQRAIASLQAGHTVEDDAGIELKAEWPEPSKFRQLAGAANALRGGVLIYVIGVDDKTGQLVAPAKQEPSEWYEQISRGFDQIAPELLLSLTVYVGDGSRSVQAMVFDTSHFPYVVNIPGQDRREVPIRVGSHTKSARRNQIIRIFDPVIRPPAFELTECSLTVAWDDRPVKDARRLQLEVHVRSRVFIEHLADHPVTLPERRMRSRLRFGERDLPLTTRTSEPGSRPGLSRRSDQPSSPPQFGVSVRHEHVVATAPGEFAVSAFNTLKGEAPDDGLSALYESFQTLQAPAFDLALTVVGTDQPVRLTRTLERTQQPRREGGAHLPAGYIEESLGTWRMPDVHEDPWSG